MVVYKFTGACKPSFTGDYVAGFIGVSEGNAFGLDEFSPAKLNDGLVVTRGQGNHCSVEFNMLYCVMYHAVCLTPF